MSKGTWIDLLPILFLACFYLWFLLSGQYKKILGYFFPNIFPNAYRELIQEKMIERGICCSKCKNTEFRSLTNHNNKFYCEKCIDSEEVKL